MNLRVKDVCKEKGITITQLAEKLNIKQESLSRAINGNPTLETLDKISIALGVDIWELFTAKKEDVVGTIRIGEDSHNINSIEDIENLLGEIKKSKG